MLPSRAPPHHAGESGGKRFTRLLLPRLRYALCVGPSGVAGVTGSGVGAVNDAAGETGSAVGVTGGVGGIAGVVGLGVGAGAAVAGAVDETVPLISAFCFLDDVVV